MGEMKTIFLALSVVLALVSIVPYVWGIVRGRVRPNVVTWSTWTLLTGIATAAEIAAGEHVSAIFTAAATLGTGAIVLLAVWRGYVRFTRFDIACQVAAVVGIVLWQLFDSPAIGVVAAVVVDFIGALPTIRHAWLKPHEEDWLTFALAATGGAFAVGALESFNVVSLSFALYIVLIDTTFTTLIFFRQRI